MSERDDGLDEEIVERLRGGYNPPPEPPREAMWAVIRDGLRDEGRVSSADAGDELAARRRARASEDADRTTPSYDLRRWGGWAVAAAALMVLGVGVGRMTAPSSQGPSPEAPSRVAESADAPLRQAAARHLRGTETLLALVRSDARSGELGPEVRSLARTLLGQTRLFLDTTPQGDPELRRLMQDLELVLAQVVGTRPGSDSAGTELDLALEGMDRREVLPRMRQWSGTMAGT